MTTQSYKGYTIKQYNLDMFERDRVTHILKDGRLVCEANNMDSAERWILETILNQEEEWVAQ